MKQFRVLCAAYAALLTLRSFAAAESQDAEFEKVADEFIKGWLADHPLTATSLGFHEYDGRINDFTRLSIDAELSRLRRFDERLKKFDLSEARDTARRSTSASCKAPFAKISSIFRISASSRTIR